MNVSDAQRTVNDSLGAAAAGNDLKSDAVVNMVDLQIVIDGVLDLDC